MPALILLTGACLLYFKTFGSTWTYDDFMVLVENPDIRSIRQFLQDTYPGRPLRELTYLLDYKLFGLNPAGYHIQQFFWHGLNAFLIYTLVRRLVGDPWVAWLASLLFLVHPIQVEVVANVSHRKELLALAFALLSLIAYIEGFQADRRRWNWFLFAFALYFVACQAKQNVVGLPFVWAAYEVSCVSPKNRLLTRFRFGGLVVGFFGIAAFLYWFFAIFSSPNFFEDIGGLQRKFAVSSEWGLYAYYLTIIKSLSFILLRLIMPLRLAPEYTYSIPLGWADSWVVTSIFLITLYFIVLWQSFLRHKTIFLALVLVGVTWVPALNFFGYFLYPAADRYLYAPSAGLFIVLSFIVCRLLPESRVLLSAVSGITLALLCVLCWQQISVWQTNYSLYTHALEINPLSSQALKGLGKYAYEEGNFETSLEFFNRTIKISPEDPETLNSIGAVYGAMGRGTEALQFFRQSLAMKPDFVHANINIGLALGKVGDVDQAINYLTKAIASNPGIDRSYIILAEIYLDQGQLQLAEETVDRGLTANPKSIELSFQFGMLLYKFGKYGEALKCFYQVLEQDPDHEGALINLALTFVTLGDRDVANKILMLLDVINPARAEGIRAQIRASGGG